MADQRSTRRTMPGGWRFGERRRPPLVAPRGCRRLVACAALALLAASCGGGEPVRTSGSPTDADQAEAPEVVPASWSWDMFLAPDDLGEGYGPSELGDYLGPAESRVTGEPRIQYDITEMGEGCRPTQWTAKRPLEWGYRWYDAPDGGRGWQDITLMESTEDAADMVASARLTLGASMNDPACQQMNLIAPSEGAEPGDYELKYPVYDIADCGVGDDCHGVVTELNPCLDGPDGRRCTPTTEVFFYEGPVVVSVGYSAPEGASTSVPIEQLIAASQRAAERVRGTSPTRDEGPTSRVDINVPSASPDLGQFCTLYDDRPAPPELLFEGEPIEDVLPALDALVEHQEELLAVAPLDAPVGQENALRVSVATQAELIRRAGTTEWTRLMDVATPDEMMQMMSIMATPSDPSALESWVEEHCPS